MSESIRWQQINDEPFEYAIQQGLHGDNFVKLLDGSCLRRPPGQQEQLARYQTALIEISELPDVRSNEAANIAHRALWTHTVSSTEGK